MVTDRSLQPAAVIAQAVAQLRVDSHHSLAADLDQVGAYLRQLAVTQEEIIEASDSLLEQTPKLLHPPSV